MSIPPRADPVKVLPCPDPHDELKPGVHWTIDLILGQNREKPLQQDRGPSSRPEEQD